MKGVDDYYERANRHDAGSPEYKEPEACPYCFGGCIECNDTGIWTCDVCGEDSTHSHKGCKDEY